MPFSMSGGLAGLSQSFSSSVSGVTVTDLAVPTVQKIMTLRTRKTGVAHIYHQSGKVVASPQWDLKRDTAIPRTDPEYAKVENGRDVDELRILAPTEEDASPPTFGSAQLRSRIDEDAAEAGTLYLTAGGAVRETLGADSGYQIVYSKVGDFVTVVVTRSSEILESIA